MKPLTKDLGNSVDGFPKTKVYYEWDILEAVEWVKGEISDREPDWKELMVLIDEAFQIK